MSSFNDIDIECPHCGREFRGTVWVAVHAGVDPELKDLLLGGEINLVSCPECGHVAFYENFLIYQEPDAELVAYVYPDADRARRDELTRMMLRGFHEAQDVLPDKDRLHYDPILLFGLEELIEMLHKEEAFAEQSQVAQILCKENKLKSLLLSPSQARRLGTMRVLPHNGKTTQPSRTEVIGGIDRLLKLNPALDLYTVLRDKIKNDPNWGL